MILRLIAVHMGEENGEDFSTMHSLCYILTMPITSLVVMYRLFSANAYDH